MQALQQFGGSAAGSKMGSFAKVAGSSAGQGYEAGSTQGKWGGMLSGGAKGAQAGSSAGPWGMAIGAVVGAGMGYFKGKTAQKQARYNKSMILKQEKLARTASAADLAMEFNDYMSSLESGWAVGGGGLGSSGSRAAIRKRATSEKDLMQSRSDLNLFLKQRKRRAIEKAGKKSVLQQIVGAGPGLSDMAKMMGKSSSAGSLAPNMLKVRKGTGLQGDMSAFKMKEFDFSGR
jgi:hypothetical protein